MTLHAFELPLVDFTNGLNTDRRSQPGVDCGRHVWEADRSLSNILDSNQKEVDL